MLPAKIQTTNTLRQEISKQRINKNITLSELANSINKTVSYLSAIEKGRVKSISSKDLIIIIKQLFDLSDNESESKIENLLSEPINKINSASSEEFRHKSLESKNLEGSLIFDYDIVEDSKNDEEFNKLFDSFKKGLLLVFDKNSDLAVTSLKRLVASMHFDLGFMMAIMRIPFFALNNLSHQERQKFLNEISESFKKYAIIAQKHINTKKENIQENTKDDFSDPSKAGTDGDSSKKESK